jgi:hypothetical protein
VGTSSGFELSSSCHGAVTSSSWCLLSTSAREERDVSTLGRAVSSAGPFARERGRLRWRVGRRADEVGQGPAPAGPGGEAGCRPSLVVSPALSECVGDRQRDPRAPSLEPSVATRLRTTSAVAKNASRGSLGPRS